MTHGSDGGVNTWSSGNSIPDVVAGLYYRYGLFVATHPAKCIILAISSFALLSTPLWYLPFPGYLPQDYVTSIHNYSVPPPAPEGGLQLSPSPTPTPLWYQGPPRAYIQQVVVRSVVTPWRSGITVGESIRGPLSTVFHLSQIIGDFQMKKNRSITLGSECLLVEGVVHKIKSASGPSLPHFNCLMLSPADLWGRNYEAFKADEDVLLTIKSLKARHEEETSIADILFGLPSKDVGISSNPHHPQVISYAFTIALKQYSENFVSCFEDELKRKFPFHQPVAPPRETIVHVYFPSMISVWEFLILLFYLFLFSSIYFSVLKMKSLCSKFGLAFSIMSALIASLCIAASLSAHFGLRPLHSRGKYVYPVLAALIGFENSMALVRAVLSSPDHLDVKIRVAQGLAKEGWTITKYFLSMITVVTISFFLFIPLVQEICIYGSLVLLCDLYLQMLFITSVIAVDLHRCQDTDRHKRSPHVNPLFRYPSIESQSPVRLLNQETRNENQTCVPNLHKRHTPTTRGEDRLAPPQSKPQPPENIPKRLRLTYFVARKRMFQRLLIFTFLGWIVWMIYASELVKHLTDPVNNIQPHTRDLASVIFSLTNRSVSVNQSNPNETVPEIFKEPLRPHLNASNSGTLKNSKIQQEDHQNRSEISYLQLKHKRRSFVRRLPISHWPALFSYYNISLRGHYLSILPPILLSLPISPEEAKLNYNSQDPNSKEWMPHYGSIDFASNYENWQEQSAIIPSSRGELFVTAVLIIPAIVVMVYATIALYRCICSRNYAEWRSSKWGKDHFKDETAQIIGEAMPLILSGHRNDVECLSTDGSIVVSSCLAGTLCAWDPGTGECLATVNRCRRHKTSLSSEEKSHPSSIECHCGVFREYSVLDHFQRRRSNQSSLESYGGRAHENNTHKILQPSNSLPSLKSAFPDLSSTIDLRFRKMASGNCVPSSRFDHIRQLYQEFNAQTEREGVETLNYSVYDRRRHSPPRKLCHHSRNLSTGSIPINHNPVHLAKLERSCSNRSEGNSDYKGTDNYRCSPIWCLECMDGLVYIGTGAGTLEVWDILSSTLKAYHDDGNRIGLTSVKLSGNRIVGARLTGSVDILTLEAVKKNCQSNPSHGQCNDMSKPPGCCNRNDLGGWASFTPDESLRIVRQSLVKAHQQPITVLSCDKSRVFTGSHDHTLKVLNILNGCVLFTLHGHFGPITSIALGGPLGDEDPSSVGIAVDFGGVGAVVASGAQDGSLCVWDFHTGACVYNVQAHDGIVLSLTCTSSYILSLGSDEKMCVWERFQGHLLNTLTVSQMYCSSMVMLTNRLLITSQQGSLTVWDITAGAPVRVVRLGDRDQTVFVRHLLPVAGSIVCDYGNQLRIVRLLVAQKLD